MDGSGAVVWSADSKPYGELINESGSITIGNPATTGLVYKPKFRFPGQIEDPETGLSYNHWRYYQPGLGNYTRPDPIDSKRMLGSRDLTYIYAINNPVILTDRRGLFSCEDCCNGYERSLKRVRDLVRNNARCFDFFVNKLHAPADLKWLDEGNFPCAKMKPGTGGEHDPYTGNPNEVLVGRDHCGWFKGNKRRHVLLHELAHWADSAFNNDQWTKNIMGEFWVERADGARGEEGCDAEVACFGSSIGNNCNNRVSALP
jgi:RHS repeat-associated protein